MLTQLKSLILPYPSYLALPNYYLYYGLYNGSSCIQMVDRLDEGAIAAGLGPLDYKGLYKV